MSSTRSDRYFNRIVVGAVTLGFLTLVVVGSLGVNVMQQNLNFTAWVAHTYEVEAATAEFRIIDERMETARRGYLLSHDDRFARTITTAADDVERAIDHISDLTRDNPQQQANVRRLRMLVADQVRAIKISVAFARSGASNTTAFYRDAGVSATRDIRALARQMTEQERQRLDQRNAARLETVRNLLIIASAAGILLLFVAAGTLWVILRYTRDLTASRLDLSRLNANLESQVRSRTADLQRANDEIQRFAYIVSHDLRSPLVNVMGFTSELEAAAKPLGQLLERAEAEAPDIVSDDARNAVRVDLPESIGFIRTSTRKMDRLINAILQLSREGRRVLSPEALDMARLLAGVADNLKHRSGELGAEIEIDPATPSIVSDRLAVEQVFSNLLENALKYLKRGRPGRITVRGSRQGERVVYEVTDNGRGIDPKDHERIFDLFRRSGAQDQPGEGIGLAHVRALTYRLGGTIGCESALDQGATFRVSLPAKLFVESPVV
jgi:signal transduction histidine kinase